MGRTGNGKTALASDHSRRFVGDHEHLWTTDGLVALERGCYPRVEGLTSELQPLIDAICHRFGTLLERVLDLTHRPRALRSKPMIRPR
jgi:phosphoenolpyruvate carboxykinase (ATP)